MSLKNDLSNLQSLVDVWQVAGPESTGARVVNYKGDVYNVVGSTGDPHIGGLTWKQLLILYGINGPCYVNPSDAPGSSSHPAFSVGGHMTNRSDGYVPDGGNCLLMPICSWHNSTARDGQAFHHYETEMLELTGYYQSDFAASFVARLPDERPFSLIYASDEGWQAENLSAEQGEALVSGTWPDSLPGDMASYFVLLERQRAGTRVTHRVHEARL